MVGVQKFNITETHEDRLTEPKLLFSINRLFFVMHQISITAEMHDFELPTFS